MDDILTAEQNLQTLAAVFRREIIVPSIVQSMSNEKIERLDVTAIADRVRLRELCKEDEENNSRSSMYLKLTLYGRNECIFSIVGVLGRSLKVEVSLVSLFSSTCKWIHVHFLLFYFAEKFFESKILGYKPRPLLWL